jgi:hypothetical protein
MFSKFFSFVAGFLQAPSGDSSSKRLAMLSTVYAGLLVFCLSFCFQKEIPSTAMTLITTLITATSLTYTITRWKESGKVDSVEKNPNSQDG